MEGKIRQLFESWADEPVVDVMGLSANGSNRKYWRVIGKTHRCIASYNADIRENEAFYYYASEMLSKGIKVPQVYCISDDRMLYLQQDLGDTTLYNYVYDKRRLGGGFDGEILSLYKKVLDDLSLIQVAGRNFDFSKAYPRSDFDAQSIQWDLNYFKYYFLKMRYIPFDEQLLEQDFQVLIKYLLEADCGFFLYRDFQSRNIMLCDGVPYYIDFQGGRRGAAQYDVASLLYSAKSDIPEVVRRDLLEHYFHCLSNRIDVNKTEYLHHFYAYVLVRIMQAMGAYGYRGYFERKDYFLNSIPLAINNLRIIIESFDLPIDIPHLKQVWKSIVDSELSQKDVAPSGLTVTVNSFSYKKGIPSDPSGNGGGYVFDCRALPNPGRYPEYRCYTGMDKPVIDFLKDDKAVENFLLGVQSLVGPSISMYLERKFTSLTVSFGCTGGQHRSVYCAERTAEWISKSFDCQVIINHIEQQSKKL